MAREMAIKANIRNIVFQFTLPLDLKYDSNNSQFPLKYSVP